KFHQSISIYYHMYSGESPASLAALKAVHDWVRAQDINPMWLSEYAKRARATHRLALGSPLAHLDRSPATTAQTKLAFREPTTSAWIAAALDLKTVRLPQRLLRTNKPSSKSKSKSKPFPRLSADQGIAGYKAIHQDLYLHLTAPKTRIDLVTHAPAQPYLYDSNGQIDSWHTRTENRVTHIDFQARSHTPLLLRLTQATNCSISYRLDSIDATAEPTRVHGTVKTDSALTDSTLTDKSGATENTHTLSRFLLASAPEGLSGRITCQP
ncbi:MAG: hypothetical protein P8144_10280, partial [Gammaproteobacteria bacterium]